MLLLTEKEEKSWKKEKFCHKCKEEFNEELSEDKYYSKLPSSYHFVM